MKEMNKNLKSTKYEYEIMGGKKVKEIEREEKVELLKIKIEGKNLGVVEKNFSRSLKKEKVEVTNRNHRRQVNLSNQ